MSRGLTAGTALAGLLGALGGGIATSITSDRLAQAGFIALAVLVAVVAGIALDRRQQRRRIARRFV